MISPDTPSTLGDYMGILRRRRIYLFTIMPAAILVSAFIAFVLTPYYRSSATILFEPASVSESLAKTLSSYADQQFEIVQRRLLTVQNLEPLVKEIDPYPDSPEMSASDKAQQIIADTSIERVDPVTLEMLSQSNAFSIHYLNSNPELAAAVAQKLAELFLDYNRLSRSERATAAYQFLLTQTEHVAQQIGEVDTRIAQFKLRHPDALPETQIRNLGAAERASSNLFDIEAQIRRAEERQGLLEVQLTKLNPTLGSTTGNPQSELATLQGQLAEARVRYTPDHPDVKRLQRQIEALSVTAAQDPGGTRVVPNNPDYISVESQLESARREIAALRSNAAQERQRLYALESGAAAAPNVERDFSVLLRDRTALQAQFDDLQKRLREATISQNLETEQRGDRFTQIRTPSVADLPHSPNRIGIILLGLVLGVGLAIGLAALAESSDPSVRSTRDLREITNIAAIASVPTMLGDEDRRRQRVWRASYAGALALATGIVVITALNG